MSANYSCPLFGPGNLNAVGFLFISYSSQPTQSARESWKTNNHFYARLNKKDCVLNIYSQH